ncbi:hypothetical protein [Halocatena pleomorpha]|nr:hypothetical protein [Halocatena pleomorpha]
MRHIAKRLQSVTAAVDIPKSVLVGQETADRPADQTQRVLSGVRLQ